MASRRRPALLAAVLAGPLRGAAALNGHAWALGLDEEMLGLASTASASAPSSGFLVEYGNGWTEDGKFSLKGGSRMYLAQDWAAPDWWAAKYQRFNLLGKWMTWTVDLSNVGCGVIACLYFSAMQDPGPGPNYCDITPGAGACVEVDVMEANRHGYEVSLHTHGGRAFDGSCNEMGCSTNVGRYPFTIERPFASPQKLYGVGAEVIDTQRPFKVTVFTAKDGAMDVHLSQEGRVLPVYNRTAAWNFNTIDDFNNQAAYPEAGGIPPQDLLPAVAAMNNGMTLVSSLWQGDARWLDMTACSGQPNADLASSSFTVSDLVVSDAPGGGRGLDQPRGRGGDGERGSEHRDGEHTSHHRISVEALSGKSAVAAEPWSPRLVPPLPGSALVLFAAALGVVMTERRRRGAGAAGAAAAADAPSVRSLLAADDELRGLA